MGNESEPPDSNPQLPTDNSPLASIGPALGRVASGIYVVTAMRDGARLGMLASFIEQAGFAPPTISMAMGRDRPIRAVLENGGLFGVNILGKSNGALVGPFAKIRNGVDPFDKLPLVENSLGLPRLADAMAFLACRVTGWIDAADHVVYIAEVLDGALQQPGDQPMVRIRQNGFDY